MEIKFTGVPAYDSGYGLNIGGVGRLDDIISVALGTRASTNSFGEFKDVLHNFECANCDITVTITPHYPSMEINGEDAEKFLEGQYERIKKIAETGKED